MGSAADLTLRPEGEGADVRRLFSDHATAPARVVSGTVVHLLAVAALVLLARMIPEQVLTSVLPRRLPHQLIWLSQPGTSGGGGGGNRTTQPPRQAQVKGTEPVSVPASSEPEPPIVEPVTIPET